MMKTLSSLLLIIVLSTPAQDLLADTYNAVIGFATRSELSLPVSGVVSKVNVSAGRHVKQGETLIMLDDAPFRANRMLMKSNVALHQVRLDEAKRDLEFQQELYDRTVLSTVELENAQLRVKRDSALLESAKAKLAMADYAMTYTKLKAPFDAIIIDVQVNEGQAINNSLQSKTLVSVVRKGHYLAGFKVDSEQLDRLETGSPVKVVIGNDSYPAIISSIFYESESAYNTDETRRFRAEATFSTQSDSILAGRKATVETD